jgi:hypothetical protein
MLKMTDTMVYIYFTFFLCSKKPYNGLRFSRRRLWQDTPRIPVPKVVGCNRLG